MLIDKKKFDLRVYVLIKGVDPLEAYLCDEGLARFCTENYHKPTRDNKDKLLGHLTNYSLNKNSDKFIESTKFFEENNASKRLMSKLFQSISSKCDLDKLKE